MIQKNDRVINRGTFRISNFAAGAGQKCRRSRPTAVGEKPRLGDFGFSLKNSTWSRIGNFRFPKSGFFPSVIQVWNGTSNGNYFK